MLHGLLLVRKPSFITSHDVVSCVRRALKTKNIGHTGTLDPLASGLMILVIGEATKLSDYILNGSKSYRVKVQLGMTTDSLDVTGEILSKNEAVPEPFTIKSVAEKLQGDFMWEVPMFSAIKQDGKKLYQYAHRGETAPVIPKRPMSFWELKTLSVGSDFYEGHLHCSKGSYIRTWAQNLGAELHCGGVVAELERTSCVPYALDQALDLENVADHYQNQSEAWRAAFVPLNKTLPHWPTITVRGKDERLLNNGQISYDLEKRLVCEEKLAHQQQDTVGIKVLSADTGRMLAILEAKLQRGLKIRRVFKLT